MSSKLSIVKSIVVSAAFAAGVSGMARADDSSMSRFGGESYADFNQPTSNGSADPAWRQSHPNGLSEREFQALSSEGPAWHQPNQSATSALASTNDATNMPS